MLLLSKIGMKFLIIEYLFYIVSSEFLRIKFLDAFFLEKLIFLSIFYIVEWPGFSFLKVAYIKSAMSSYVIYLLSYDKI